MVQPNIVGVLHKDFFTGILANLEQEPRTEITVVFALQPPKFTNGSVPESGAKAPFTFVMTQKPLLTALAKQLRGYREDAKKFGKNLRIVIRYASEMNDLRINSQNKGVNAWGQQPVMYKASFQLIHDIFKAVDSEFLMAFSPALRRDLHPSQRPEIFTIAKYYPGDDVVDVVSGTWYVGMKADLNLSADLFTSHMILRKQKKALYGLDEVGGFHKPDEGKPTGPCDPTLLAMLDKVKNLAQHNIQLDYLTFFMQDGNRPWSQAQLSFL